MFVIEFCGLSDRLNNFIETLLSQPNGIQLEGESYMSMAIIKLKNNQSMIIEVRIGHPRFVPSY